MISNNLMILGPLHSFGPCCCFSPPAIPFQSNSWLNLLVKRCNIVLGSQTYVSF
jgi:hypothetical protein